MQLQQAIRRREWFIILTGDIGTGKTTTCRALLQHLDKGSFVSLILNPFVSTDELLREVLLDFGLVSRESVREGRLTSATTHDLVSVLHDFLRSLEPLKARALLIIDEAQHLSIQVLEQLRVMSNLETHASKLLQIVLVGQNDLLDTLETADLRQFSQRISLRATLTPLARAEVESYVAHRLSIARGATAVTFEIDALSQIHDRSGGVPRVINLLCDRALMIGAAQRRHHISPDIMIEAANNLGLKSLPAASRGRWVRYAFWIALALALGTLVAAALLATFK